MSQAIDEARTADHTADQREDLAGELAAVAAQMAQLRAQTSALHDTVGDLAAAKSEEIAQWVAGNDNATQHVEKIATALAVELAEVGQAINDQFARSLHDTAAGLMAGLEQMSHDIEALGESFADALAQVTDRLEIEGPTPAPPRRKGRAIAASAPVLALPAPPPPPPAPVAAPAVISIDPHVEELAETTSEAVNRIETLLEVLLETNESRPADLGELTAKTLERLGLTVGARIEASTQAAVEAIDETVSESIERAVQVFRDALPPQVDRSTTAAITRLEERVAALTRRLDDADVANKSTLNGLEETVGRLATAQAEDFERVLDTVEATAAPSPANPDDVAEAVAEAVAVAVAGQLDSLVDQVSDVRRRLSASARSRTALDEATMHQLADLVATRLEASPGPARVRRARPTD